jgi:hypothetical protein
MAETPKAYILKRIGKSIKWSVESNGSYGQPYRREYDLMPRGLDGMTLVCTIKAEDFDKLGNRVTHTPMDFGSVSIGIAGLLTPGDLLEEVARHVDPNFFVGKIRQITKASGGLAEMDKRIAELDDIKNRPNGELIPTHESVERLRKFWTENPNLVPPDIFSSKDGVIRGRWQDGANKTIWLSFQATGPMGITISIPRNGNYGLMRVNLRCIDDQDIIPIAQQLGIRCTRG